MQHGRPTQPGGQSQAALCGETPCRGAGTVAVGRMMSGFFISEGSSSSTCLHSGSMIILHTNLSSGTTAQPRCLASAL